MFDVRFRKMRWGFSEETPPSLAMKDASDSLGVEIDPRRIFSWHLETVVCKGFLGVTLLRRVKHLDVDSLVTLYKAQVRLMIKYSPLTWMLSSTNHFSLLDKVQRKAEHLINSVRGCHTNTNTDNTSDSSTSNTNTKHRKARVQQKLHLSALSVKRRGTETSKRTMLAMVHVQVITMPHTTTNQRGNRWI